MSTPQAQTADFYNDSATGLSTKTEVNRDKTRYVLVLGDHVEDDDKLGFKSLGAHFGGLWVGPSETEGAPTMKRTNYFMYRGGIIPLETTAIPRKADHREVERRNESFLVGENVPPGTRGYTVYAGDTLNYLQNDYYKPLGIVELKGLQFLSWQQSNAKSLQTLLFPKWFSWLQGVKAPVTMDDWMQEVLEAFNKTPDLQTLLGEDILEANRRGRVWMKNHIERNRQAILSKRGADTGGFFVPWNGKSRLYARQLNETLENEGDLNQNRTQSAGDPRILQEMQAERKLRHEELNSQRQLINLLTELVKDKIGDVPAGLAEAYASEFTVESAPKIDYNTEESEKQFREAETAFVSTGLYGEDVEEVALTEPDTSEPTAQSEESKAFEQALEDPRFAAALENDPGLRGAVEMNPDLVGQIEEEED